MTTREKILIIKHGAFGDLIQALGPMAAIRAHHTSAHITLMTTRPFENFIRACPHIDAVYLDPRPRFYDLAGLLRLRAWLRGQHFTRVYDLQNSDRSCVYFNLISPRPRPEWVGTAYGASHRNTNPSRTAARAFDGHVQTLALAGIDAVTIDPMTWMHGDITRFALPARYALIIPGSSPQHTGKRWPAAHYRTLAAYLITRGIAPVLIGTDAERDILDQIAAGNPGVINLAGQTKMTDLPDLARGATMAIGNDTGPVHVCAATQCVTLTLFDTRYSNPVRHGPLGAHAHTLAVANLADLAPETVIDYLESKVGLAGAPDKINRCTA